MALATASRAIRGQVQNLHTNLLCFQLIQFHLSWIMISYCKDFLPETNFVKLIHANYKI